MAAVNVAKRIHSVIPPYGVERPGVCDDRHQGREPVVIVSTAPASKVYGIPSPSQRVLISTASLWWMSRKAVSPKLRWSTNSMGSLALPTARGTDRG